jgi:hypothetical protein
LTAVEEGRERGTARGGIERRRRHHDEWVIAPTPR